MKKLKDIITNLNLLTIVGEVNIEVNQLVFDSRKIVEGDVFFAINGTVVDGHSFVDKAISLGAKVVVCEILPSDLKNGVTFIKVDNTQEALAIIAANFYDNPSEKLKLVGVTGTNGKTTVASLLYQLFTMLGYKVGLLSTVKVLVASERFKATHTTPDSVSINKYLSQMHDAGCEYCFMEVSSHGIDQKRTSGLQFCGGVFTNLSHDHLDYHNSFAEYRDVKKLFFDKLPKSAFALVNIDDKNGMVMLQNSKAKKYTYALKTIADYKAKVLEKQFSGTLMKVNGVELWIKLIGDFNAYNILAICGVAELLGVEVMEVLRVVSQLDSVSGRFQYITSEAGLTAIVDYAHTPDALKNVLETINKIRTGKENLITVVGCGGNRDAEKRPKMGYIAGQLSDRVIFTADNPRDENPQDITNEMEDGVGVENNHKVLIILDRKQAIKTAFALARQKDIILIAGKGHEDYQEIKGEFTYFDDFCEVEKIMNLKDKA